MDPLSISASVTTLLQLAHAVARYLNDVTNAPEDGRRILLEIHRTTNLLSDLKKLAALDDPRLNGIKGLDGPNGSLQRFRLTLENLKKRLAPAIGLKGVGKALLWPFKKEEINNILRDLEREKAFFSLVLKRDNLELSHDVLQEIRHQSLGQKSRDVINWVSSLNFSTKYSDVLSTRLGTTGEWLLKDARFKNWLAQPSGVLCCPGMPGAGKTVLASIIIDFLDNKFKSEDIGIAFLYCEYKKQEQTTANLIASLVQQLAWRQATISVDLERLHAFHVQRSTRPTTDEWSKLLRLEVAKFSKIVIVIDAFDEYSENGTRDVLLGEMRLLAGNVNLLVTVRETATLEDAFENYECLNIRATENDIQSYVKFRIAQNYRLQRYTEADPDLETQIRTTLVENAQGMFLLARLHMDSLALKNSLRDLRVALENLPKELDRTYSEALRRIDNQGEDDAKLGNRVLAWLSYALRPLSVRELQHALAIEPHVADIDEEALPDEDILVSVCAGLVAIDRESKIIRFVHYTTQEYFERDRGYRYPHGHMDIARACITYMSFEAFANGYLHSDEETETRLQKFPLLHYVAQHWGDHTREGKYYDVDDRILQLLMDNVKLSSFVQAMNIGGHRCKGYTQQFPRDTTGLHVAAHFNLCKTIESLIQMGVDIKSKSRDGRTALHSAAARGHEAAVRLLWENGAEVDATDNDGNSALHRAVASGHNEVVKLLVEEMDAKIEGRDRWNNTVLHCAVLEGHEAVTRLLIEIGADLEAKNEWGGTALHCASSRGAEAVAQLLISSGSNVKAQANDGWTALHSASAMGGETIVQILIANGSDVNARGKTAETPLHVAADGGHKVVASVLVEKGANVDLEDDFGGTALERAALRDHDAVLRLLLENSAAVAPSLLEDDTSTGPVEPETLMDHLTKDIHAKARDTYKWTALHKAAAGGHGVVVRQLIESGADVNALDVRGNTALHYAAIYGCEDAVLVLVECEANIHVKDRNGWTALDIAKACGHAAIVSVLHIRYQRELG